MAITYTYSGSLELAIALAVAGTGDSTQDIEAVLSASVAFDPSTAPIIAGILSGTFVAAAGDLLLAHATDPLQSMGDATYPAGFAPSGTHRIKLLVIRNNDITNTVTVARGAANGLPVFDAASDALTLAPGDLFLFYKKAGTAVLTTGSNDKLTISVGGGTPSCDILVAYGP